MVNGIITAICTPFLNNKIDFESLQNILNKQVEAKVSAIVMFGSTGEGSNIEPEEYEFAIRFVADFLSKTNVKLFVGASSMATIRVVKLCNIAKENGAFGVLIAPSPYNKPTQDGIFDIYKQASQVGLSVIAYNIPGRACVDISDETIIRISELPNLIAIKDSTGDIRRIINLKQKLNNKNFGIFCGDDYMFLSSMVHGANGIISVASNIVPQKMVQIYDFCIANDYKNANKLYNDIYPLLMSLFCQSNPIPVKFAAKYLGLIKSDELRAPLFALSDPKLIEILTKDIDLAL